MRLNSHSVLLKRNDKSWARVRVWSGKYLCQYTASYGKRYNKLFHESTVCWRSLQLVSHLDFGSAEWEGKILLIQEIIKQFSLCLLLILNLFSLLLIVINETHVNLIRYDVTVIFLRGVLLPGFDPLFPDGLQPVRDVGAREKLLSLEFEGEDTGVAGVWAVGLWKVGGSLKYWNYDYRLLSLLN